jgi:hypothetical protein
MKVIAQLYKIIPYQSMWNNDIRTMKEYKLMKSQFLSDPDVETFITEKGSLNTEELWNVEDSKSREIRLMLSRKATNHKYYMSRKNGND